MAQKCDYYMTRSDGVMLVKTYSTENFKIQKVGTNEMYEEAIDIGYYNASTQSYSPLNYSYIETNEKIKTEEELESGGTDNA